MYSRSPISCLALGQRWGLGSRQSGSRTRAAGHPSHADPPQQEHRRVVVHVQERDLSVLLPQHEERGVGELQQLGDVVEPQCTSYLKWWPKSLKLEKKNICILVLLEKSNSFRHRLRVKTMR